MVNAVRQIVYNIQPLSFDKNKVNIRNSCLSQCKNDNLSGLSSDCFQSNNKVGFKGNIKIDLGDFPGVKDGLVAKVGSFDDLERIIDLYSGNGTYARCKHKKKELGEIQRDMNLPGACTILLEKNDELVGCAQLYGYLNSCNKKKSKRIGIFKNKHYFAEQEPKRIGVFWNVFVSEKYRGKKYASWMIGKLIDQAKKNSISEVCLVASNVDAVRLYTRFKFEKYVPITHDDYDVHLFANECLMRLKLT